MTRLAKVGSVAELPVELAPYISFQVVDGNIEAVVLTMNDKFVRIVKSGEYSVSLKVLKEEPKKEVEQWVLSGKYLGLSDVSEVFTSEREADARLDEYKEKAHYTDTGLEIKKCSVFVTQDKL